MSKRFIEASLKRYGKLETYLCKEILYKKYTNAKSKADKDHNEYLFFIEKKDETDITYESPLNYIGSKAKMIANIKSDIAAGKPTLAFPPVRAAHFETIPNSLDGTNENVFGASKDGPNLGKLAQHQMSNVLGPMEETLNKDRDALRQFVNRCGKKLPKWAFQK